MSEYYVGSVSSSTDTAEIWRRGEGGLGDERINLCSLGTASVNRTLDFEFFGDTVVVTDAFDSSYRLEYDVSNAGHNDSVYPD